MISLFLNMSHRRYPLSMLFTEEMGETGINLLHKRIQMPSIPRRVLLNTELVVRQSTNSFSQNKNKDRSYKGTVPYFICFDQIIQFVLMLEMVMVHLLELTLLVSPTPLPVSQR